jgi:Caspase domain/TIR domain
MTGMDNAHALVIGIANYQHISGLPATVLNDAQEIYNLLIDPSMCGYQPGNVTLLRDQEATQAAIRQALADLSTRANADSTVFFYISSHGGRVETGPAAGEYLLPVDTDYASSEAVARTAIAGAEFTAALRAIPARKVLVAFDCCHSGGIGQPKAALAPAIKAGFSDSYYDQLKSGKGRVILASSRNDEYSWVLPGAPNSLFTQQLLAGLRGGIASEDGLIRIFELFEYIQPRITAAQQNQHPIFKGELEENFPITLYVGGKKGVVAKTEDGYKYDVYVSYSEKDPDATWVWETLLPQFEQAGLKVAVSDDVAELGVARVVNIDRGMQQARRTLAVLSPSYMQNNMAQFESVLGQTMSVEEGRARLFTAFLAEIDNSALPPRLSSNMIGTVNLSDLTSRRGKLQLDKLIGALKSPLGKMF